MRRRGGVTYKIFVVTTLLLVVSALLIYLTLYFMLPGYYTAMKQSRLDSGVSNLVTEIDGQPFVDALDRMIEFGQANNAVLVLRDEDGNVFPVNFARFARGFFGIGGFPGFRKLMQDHGAYPSDRPGGPGGPGGPDGERIYTVSKMIHFNESTEPFTLFVDAPLQPVDEAREVILQFLPYMLIAILLIATGGAAIYSRLIARPLLRLNVVARRLAKLDFSTAAKPLGSNDEIGELSQSLSKLAINLRTTMTELQQANEQLKDDIEREREQEAKRREFVATISHELKTPITAVSGQLEGMIGSIGAFRDRDTYLRKSYKIMKGMEKLVHEILDLSKLESRDFRPLMREVDLAGLVRDSVDNVGYLAETKGLSIECELPQEAYIAADERLIAKAVSNIICNAVQYSGEGERVVVRLTEEPGAAGANPELPSGKAGTAQRTPGANQASGRMAIPAAGGAGMAAEEDSRRTNPDTVLRHTNPDIGLRQMNPETGLRHLNPDAAPWQLIPGRGDAVRKVLSGGGGERPASRLRLEVLNTGASLDETKLPRLFEPFFRIEQSRSRATGGSGLGLYIVSKVLDAHGAAYGIENTPEGVKFTFVIAAA